MALLRAAIDPINIRLQGRQVEILDNDGVAPEGCTS